MKYQFIIEVSADNDNLTYEDALSVIDATIDAADYKLPGMALPARAVEVETANGYTDVYCDVDVVQ